MKKLIIRRGSLNLAEVYPTKPVILIGRSPVCDVILRASGVQPIHFILEWIGTGDFDAMLGNWIISLNRLDASPMRNDAIDRSHLDGLVIGDSSLVYDDYHIVWVDDGLGRGEIAQGQIKRQLDDHILQQSQQSQQSQQISSWAGGHALLEVVRVAADGQSVVSVEHFSRNELRNSAFLKTERQLKIQWKQAHPVLEWVEDSVVVTRVLHELTRAANERSRAEIQRNSVELAELVQIKCVHSKNEYFLRTVSRISVPNSARDLSADPFFKYLLGGCIALALSLFGILQVMPPLIEAKVAPPARVATVER